MGKTFVGTSWKMNKTVRQSVAYLGELIDFLEENKKGLEDIEVFVLPTFLAIESFARLIRERGSDLKTGAQDCCWEDEGPFTGEVSPMHLKDIGAHYVELGHAERREYFGEDDRMINQKVLAALRNGLRPILCIGEEERPQDIQDAFRFLDRQMAENLKDVSSGQLKDIVIAYEPVWAIGADTSAPIDYIEKALDHIRRRIDGQFGQGLGESQDIIYGGSVNLESVRDILALPNNDGIFVGRSASNIGYFKDMIRTAQSIRKDIP